MTAVVDLMKTEGFSKLTVQRIIDEAQVSRRTFYKYFRDKYDAVNSYFSWYIEKVIVKEFNGHNWDEIGEKICIFLRDNASYFNETVGNGTSDSFYSFMRSWAEKRYTEFYLLNTHKQSLSVDEQLMISFYALGNMVYVERILKHPNEFSDPNTVHDYVRKVLEPVPEIYYTELSYSG